MAEQTNPETENQQPTAELSQEQAADSVPEDTLTAELETCRQELAKQQDMYLRTRAEMENFRRRLQREKEELGKFANESLLREMLPVMDNLERAVMHAAGSDDNLVSLLDGVKLTLGQFQKVLEKFNVTALEAKGKIFDPACHEAMGQLERDDCEANTVVEVMQTGYLLNDRLLRPALVLISKTAPPATEN